MSGARAVAQAAGRVLAGLGLAAALVACPGERGGPGVYDARGVVEDVDAERGQVLIEHEDVPGLMPAMTMNFAVPDAEVLAALAPGQEIEFELRFTGRSYEVESFEVVGEAPYDEGWRRLGDALVRSSPAPPFDLLDQSGARVTLEDLRDRVLLVDFVYTECPGPCPIQTSALVGLQRSLPADLQDRIHFVSISLDPAVDRPQVFARYASERGVDLAHWSFLTGDTEPVAALVRAWGVGSVRKADGTIDHTLILFAVKDGRVMERYTLADVRSGRLRADLVQLAMDPPDPASSGPEASARSAGEAAAGEGEGEHAGEAEVAPGSHGAHGS